MDKKILKIFRSFDFRNNKIINAKVDTPEDLKHIANKEYVDNTGKYDTEKANTYQNPFQFPLILNTFEKTFKQLFDDLFFPRILPLYTNPILKNCDIVSNKNLSFINGKHNVFYDQEIQLLFDCETLDNDRTSTNDYIIKVLNPITNVVTSSILSGTKQLLTFVLVPNMVFSFEKLYNPITIAKQDSYGDYYIENGFGLLYNLIVDITQNFNNFFNCLPSPIISTIREEEGIPTYVVETNVDEIDFITDFEYINTKLIPNGIEGIFDILIPKEYIANTNEIKNYNIYLELFLSIENNGIEELTCYSKTQLIIDWLIVYTNNEIIILNDIEYFKYQINLGIFEQNMRFKLSFEK